MLKLLKKTQNEIWNIPEIIQIEKLRILKAGFWKIQSKVKGRKIEAKDKQSQKSKCSNRKLGWRCLNINQRYWIKEFKEDYWGLKALSVWYWLNKSFNDVDFELADEHTIIKDSKRRR